ncbi:ABC transporter substrate-binding protein [Leptolyngbya sp. NK1-12]|uniref:ABC transporter substrate-binding protein n=1 Tax=Leptolyngbya sp. NK1-12 TaxID=2547451 RepID=A0AA97AJZ1_9CYAN|nr:ABC transporter substrate-binding protein [Leptolyngbya sp. NK1-12]WNZ27179.1 ABC transporter substrate-binding protein [Leptolyngbya sp. NK1-12]
MNVHLLIRRLRRLFSHWLFHRWRWVGVAVTVCLGILFASVAFSQQPVHVTMLTSALDAAQERHIIEAFEAKNPDIKVDVIEGPNASNLIEDLYTSSFLLGGSPYDLVMMDIVWLPKFAAAGWLLDLSDRVTQADLADFLPADVEGSRYDDKLYRMPIRTDAGLLYYREDLLQQAGVEPPETFADLIQVSQQLQDSDVANWGYVWQGRQYEGLSAMFLEVLAGSGGFWINPETREVGLDRPETLKAIEFLRSTISQGVSPPGVTTYQEEEARRLFQNGEAVFMRNWPYALPLTNSEDSPIKGKVGIKPMVHAPNQESAGCLGGWGLGIARSSPNVDAAWRVVEYYSSTEAQRNLVLKNGYLPSRRSLYTDPQIVQEYPYFPDMLEVAESAVLRPPVAQYAQASDILQRYLSAALTNRMEPEQAMRAAAEETRTLLKRYAPS